MRVHKDRVRELQQRIAELKASLPRHSVPPSMLIQLEELEDELKRLLTQDTGKENEVHRG